MGSSGKFAKSEKFLLALTVLYCAGLLGLAARSRPADAAGYRITAEHPAAQTEAEEVPRAVRIDLNRATAAELQTLPGIEETLAERIVAYRAEHGPFRTAEEIMEVRGIGEGIYEDVKELITAEEAEKP